MNISLIRSAKIAVGSTLMLMALNQEYFATNSYSTLALVAVPILLAGMFDWKPLAYLAAKIRVPLSMTRHARV